MQKENHNKIVLWNVSSFAKLDFLMSVLPLFKSFILIFEQKKLFILWLNRSLGKNIRAFFSCFVKFEVINNLLYNKLNLIDVASNVQKLKTYTADENEQLVYLLKKTKLKERQLPIFSQCFTLLMLMQFIFRRNTL